MKRRYKTYLRINLVSIIFLIVSCISVTLAWFAYSGLTDVQTEVGVRSWYIELKKGEEVITNDIIINIDEIYPGMTPVKEEINIENLGDSDAMVSYSIISARILGEQADYYEITEDVTQLEIEDNLSHNYPFHINMNLSRGHIVSEGIPSKFTISVEWPLDSGYDSSDSEWGNKAYQFKQSENQSYEENSDYQVRPAIQIELTIKAEQYLNNEDVSETMYNLGDTIFYDVVANQPCLTASFSCLEMTIIDVNNKISDNSIKTIPKINNTSGSYTNYEALYNSLTTNWNVSHYGLKVEDILKIVSTDISNSILVRENISNTVIGNLNYNDRITTEITKAINGSGEYQFQNANYEFLTSDECIRLDSPYGFDSTFALMKIDNTISKIYELNNSSSCKTVPVIEISKDDYETKEYTEFKTLQYIRTNGTQYIDTDFIPNSDTKVEIKIGTDEVITGSSALFGARTSTSLNVFAVFASTASATFPNQTRFDYFGSRVSQIYNSALSAGENVIIKDETHNYINDVQETGNFGGVDFNCEYNLYIGTINTANNPHPDGFSGRIYYAKIWDNGTLIRNFIPVKTSDNKYAMYDLVNNIYYENAGSGSFAGSS